MFKLLLVTDKPQVRETYEAFEFWESMGFRRPCIVSSADEAIESLGKRHADAVSMLLDPEDEQKLLKHLVDCRPLLPLINATFHREDLMKQLSRLSSLLNRLNADFCDDDFSRTDMMQMLRHDYFRSLIGGRIQSREEAKSSLIMLRSRMNLDQSCILIFLKQPEDDDFLRGRWHYGPERLEVALRYFFGAEMNGMRILVSVLPDGSIYLLGCPMLFAGEVSVESQSGIMAAHAQEAIEGVRNYLGLELSIVSIRVLPTILDLAGND